MINVINDKEIILKLKEDVIKIENSLSQLIKSEEKLAPREQALVDRGYDVDLVKLLTKVSDNDMDKISNDIFNNITKNCQSIKHPTCIYIGGQPGCGKSSTSMDIKSSDIKNGIVEIGIDNYRTYHPNYLEMEQAIKKHWEDRVQTINDTPGNDIADFTHMFAGRMTDILIDKVSNKKYNIALEWGMREASGPLKTMKELKDKGYTNIVNFIAVHKDISLDACKIRADIMNNQKHIIRRVPDSFHELCISTLPDSCEEIYQKGYLEDKVIDDFIITTRDREIVWKKDSNTSPNEVYRQYLNNPLLSTQFKNDNTYAEQSYNIESSGIKDEIEEMFLTENEKNINNLNNISTKL